MILTGAPSPHLPSEPMRAGDYLRLQSDRRGSDIAVIDGPIHLTWHDLERESAKLAQALIDAGVGVGDRVAVWLPNRWTWWVIWLAVARSGAMLVPINSRFKAAEARYILAQSQATVVFVQESFLGMEYGSELRRILAAPEVSSPEVEDVAVQHVVCVEGEVEGSIPWDSFTDVQVTDLAERESSFGVDVPLMVVYTSGTTGHPKGAVHTHTVFRNVHAIADRLQVEPGSVLLGHMPFFHVAGSIGGLLVSLVSGASIVMMDSWDVHRALLLIERHRVSVMGGIATHFIDLLSADRSQVDLSSLRTGWIGGSTNPRAVIEGALDELGMEGLLPVYGMTETSATTTMPRIGDPREIILSGAGVPVSDFEVSIRDADAGELEAGMEGEVCVRGHSVMREYFRMPEPTAAALDAAGWFHTGDVGVIDASGYLHITGRKSDMFIVGGSNAYPAEIEGALLEHPAVAQACVVGVPESRLGEVGFAFVEMHDSAEVDAEELRSYCRGRLANYKVPQHFEPVTQWPLTDTGKLERRALKASAEGVWAGLQAVEVRSDAKEARK